MRIRIYIVAAIFLVLTNPVRALQPNLTPSRLSNLLEQPTVSSIYRDSKGILWIGTQQGLHRFDGAELRVFGADKPKRNWIPESEIKDIAEDQKGNVFIATKGGVLLQWNSRTQSIDPINWPIPPRDANLVKMLVSSFGNLWLLYQDGLRFYDPKLELIHKWTDENIVELIGISRTITEDEAGNLWIGGTAGIIKVDINTKQLSRIARASLGIQSGSAVTVIQFNPSGNLIFGTNNGELVVWDVVTNAVIASLNVEKNEQVYISQILQLQNNLVIGTDKGLYVSDNNASGLKEIRSDNAGSSSIDVYSLHHDGEYVWVGTVNGLDILTFVPFELFNFENSGVANYVLAFTQDEDGVVWIGTYSGLYYYDKNSKSHTKRELKSNYGKHVDSRIVSLESYGKGLLLGHFESGIEYLSQNSQKADLFNASHFKQMSITRILVDGKNVWIATYDHGLFRINGSQTHSYFKNRALPERSITLIFQTRDKQFFAVSENQIFQYVPETDSFDELVLNFGLDKKQPSIYAMSESEANDILIGTKDHGLFFWHNFRRKNGSLALSPANSKGNLTTSTIYGIETDRSGNLWCSTQNGIVKLDSHGRLIRRFTTADGLQGRDFSFGASFQSREGVIYFGGANGYNRFDPDTFAVANEPSRMRLTGISFPGRKSKNIGVVDELQSVELTHQDRSVTFQFSVLDFVDPERNQFRYKLENFDIDWIESGTNNTATFTNLPAGNYNLRVQGANSAGVWNRKGLSLAVTVLPAPWLTWWAFMLYGVTLLCAAWALHRIYYSYVVERRSAELALEMFEAENRADDEMQEQLEIQDEWVNSAHLHSQTTLSLITESISIRNPQLSDDTTGSVTENSIRRITALYNLEDCLCYQVGGPLANLHKYTDELFPVLLEKSPIAPETIITINEVTTIPIPVELASPLAVIIFELLENCFQHAFEPDSPANYVHVMLAHAQSDVAPYRKLELSIHDNGVGMPTDIEHLNSECSGLALVQSIVTKLGGTLKLTSMAGTVVSVEIPQLQYA